MAERRRLVRFTHPTFASISEEWRRKRAKRRGKDHGPLPYSSWYVREKELNKKSAPCVPITFTIEESREITMIPKRSEVGVAEHLKMQQRSHVE